MKVLITAGPTRERIDPVRFLSNRSSGKMGYALARAAQHAGFEVTLVSGPTALDAPPGVERIQVTSAAEMLQAVDTRFDACDALIMSAAVADWTPATTEPEKIKKGAPDMLLRLVPTVDILGHVAPRKAHQILVGFVAETKHLLEEAQRKRAEKRCDLMVANDISRPDAGFEVDTNAVVLVHGDGRTEALPLMSKEDVAHRVIVELNALIERT